LSAPIPTLENILLRHGFSKLPNKLKPDLEDVERIVGFRLPEDYRYYLLNFSGFEDFLGPEYCCLWSANELIQANNDYRLFESLPNTLGIGSNMGGEFIAIEYTGNQNYRVVLSPWIDLEAQYHIGIGDSFTDFIIRLAAGKGWFDDE
jgi:hypothetical protein